MNVNGIIVVLEPYMVFPIAEDKYEVLFGRFVVSYFFIELLE